MSFNQRPGKYHIVKLLRVHGLYGCGEVNPSTVVGISTSEYNHFGIRVTDNLLEPEIKKILWTPTSLKRIRYLSARVTIMGPVHPFNFLGSFMVRVVT